MSIKEFFKRLTSEPEDKSVGIATSFDTISIEPTIKPEPSKKETVAMVLERLATEQDAEILKEVPAYREKFQQSYDSQVKGFSFTCVRYGDFINLMMARFGNPVPVNSWAEGQTFCIALNVKNINSARLIPGKPPGDHSTVGFNSTIEDTAESGLSGGGGGVYGNYYYPHTREPNLSPTQSYRIIPVFPTEFSSKPFFYSPPQMVVVSHGGSGGGGYSTTVHYSNGGVYRNFEGYAISHTVKDFPGPSVDDEIHFSPTGHKLFVPAGLGQSVYEQILKATDISREPK